MAMTLVHRRVAGEAVEVAVAIHIPHPDALAAGEDHVERPIVVRAEPLLYADVVVTRVGLRGGPGDDHGVRHGRAPVFLSLLRSQAQGRAAPRPNSGRAGASCKRPRRPKG